MKHTKGPWKFVKNQHHDRFEIASHRETWLGSVNIDRYHADFSADEAQANAHLIAAAPEMLEALEIARSQILLDSCNYSQIVMDRIDSAIKKAKGE